MSPKNQRLEGSLLGAILAQYGFFHVGVQMNSTIISISNLTFKNFFHIVCPHSAGVNFFTLHYPDTCPYSVIVNKNIKVSSGAKFQKSVNFGCGKKWHSISLLDAKINLSKVFSTGIVLESARTTN